MRTVSKILFTLYIFIGFSVIFYSFSIVTAKEGTWIPSTIKDRYNDMKGLGMDIPFEQIYSADGTGLNNAVVLFGRGCTAEVNSSRGLILTNHHCGYGSVQRLSSPEKDYFATGFWAQDTNGELPCAGLTVTFFRSMYNVTDEILTGIHDTLHDDVRDSLIALRIKDIEQQYKMSTHLDASVRPVYHGNQYWVYLTETYKDIRLAGFPPNGIGAFGGDDENWEWPRHTGDFSIFRVYADSNNKPADYSPRNRPYHTSCFFTINAAGYKDGDFTMVYGFPGSTQEYISSYEQKQVYSITDPISVEARTLRLNVWKKHMSASRDEFLQYTSKYSGVANGWKKWQGEIEGLKASHAMKKKKKFEHKFSKWADERLYVQDRVAGSALDPDEENRKNAGNLATYAPTLLPQLKIAAKAADSALYYEQYIKETIAGIELVQQGTVMAKQLTYFRMRLADSALQDSLKMTVTNYAGFYKNYDLATDKDVFLALMPLYFKKCAHFLPDYYKDQFAKHGKDYKKWADDVYGTSLLSSQQRLTAFAAHAKAIDSDRVIADPACQLYYAIYSMRDEKILPELQEYYTKKNYLDRLYMKAQMKMADETTMQPLYPDANLTLRITYGKVQGLKNGKPRAYRYQTNLDDVIAVHDPSSDVFKAPQKLIDLYNKKDYGRWAVNGTVPVAFVASNHTTGGNSGSPTLNGKGELIGTNFDRAYEGTMSDYYFDPKRCRNISVDIRYTLFIIDKFGDAGWLLDEMRIVGK